MQLVKNCGLCFSRRDSAYLREILRFPSVHSIFSTDTFTSSFFFITVTLWGPPFKGFMMVAAEEGAKDWPTGIFYSEDGSAKRLDCLGRGDTVTHQNNSYKDSVSVLWYGPENTLSEQVQFV